MILSLVSSTVVASVPVAPAALGSHGGGLVVIVKDQSGNPIPGATVTTNFKPPEQPPLSGVTDSAGRISWADVFPGFYIMQVSKSGYANSTPAGTVVQGQTLTMQTTLTQPFDFSLSVDPPSKTVVPGQPAVATVHVNLVSGAPQPVSLFCQAPIGQAHVLCNPMQPSTVNPGGSSTITVTTLSSASGQYQVTITGNAGPVSHTTIFTVEAIPQPPSDLTLSSSSYISPTSIEAGNYFTAYYVINNPNSYPINVGLGLTIYLNGSPLHDTASDIIVSASPGTNTYQRNFNVASSASSGSYDWIMAIWKGQPGNSVQFPGYVQCTSCLIITLPAPSKFKTELVLNPLPQYAQDGSVLVFTGRLTQTDTNQGIANTRITIWDNKLLTDDMFIIEGETDDSGYFLIEWMASSLIYPAGFNAIAKFEGSSSHMEDESNVYFVQIFRPVVMKFEYSGPTTIYQNDPNSPSFDVSLRTSANFMSDHTYRMNVLLIPPGSEEEKRSLIICNERSAFVPNAQSAAASIDCIGKIPNEARAGAYSAALAIVSDTRAGLAYSPIAVSPFEFVIDKGISFLQLEKAESGQIVVYQHYSGTDIDLAKIQTLHNLAERYRTGNFIYSFAGLNPADATELLETYTQLLKTWMFIADDQAAKEAAQNAVVSGNYDVVMIYSHEAAKKGRIYQGTLPVVWSQIEIQKWFDITSIVGAGSLAVIACLTGGIPTLGITCIPAAATAVVGALATLIWEKTDLFVPELPESSYPDELGAPAYYLNNYRSITISDVDVKDEDKKYEIGQKVEVIVVIENTGNHKIKPYDLEGTIAINSDSGTAVYTDKFWNSYDIDPASAIGSSGAGIAFEKGGWLLPLGAGVGWYTIKVEATLNNDGPRSSGDKVNAFMVASKSIPPELFCGKTIDQFASVIDGTESDDILVGSGKNDLIRGFGGNDSIDGKRGADCLIGGDGNDIIYGRGGYDTIEGNAGNDLLYGNAGNDVITGGMGDDTIRGGTDNDTIDGEEGNDVCKGGSGVNSRNNCES